MSTLPIFLSDLQRDDIVPEIGRGPRGGLAVPEFSALRAQVMAGGVEGDGGLLAFVEGGGALDYSERERFGQPSLQGLEPMDFYLSQRAASVAGVGLFGGARWLLLGL